MRLNRLDHRLIADRIGRSKTPASLFDTSGLPASKRFATWCESMGVLLDISPTASHPTDQFNAHLEGYLVGDILLSRLITGGQKMRRTSDRIARDSIDHYAINFFLGGTVELQGPRLLQYGEGNLIAFDDGEPLTCETGGFDVVTATIPRRRLSPSLQRPDAVHASMIDHGSAVGQLLVEFVRTLYATAPDLAQDEARAAEQALLVLVAAALNGITIKSGDLPAMFYRAELMRAQAFIKSNLGNASLSPNLVAAAVALSRAQLYRLFAPLGGVAEYIREQRLRRCLADLLATRQNGQAITEISYRWGFADPAHFARAFKQRFGRTPSEAREAAAVHTRRSFDLDVRAGDRLYEDWLAGLA
jgi:AraC-like DNA-binding protein